MAKSATPRPKKTPTTRRRSVAALPEPEPENAADIVSHLESFEETGATIVLKEAPDVTSEIGPEIGLLTEAAVRRDAIQQQDAASDPGCGLDPMRMYFDAQWYRENYADVRYSGADPLHHYMTFGYLEGRNPNAFFNTLEYLAANPDLADGGINAFLHYILHGAAEGRPVRP